MERPIFHLRWEREALYRRKPNQTKQKTNPQKTQNTSTRTHTDTVDKVVPIYPPTPNFFFFFKIFSPPLTLFCMNS